LGIGRPLRREVPGLAALRQLALAAGAVGGTEIELVLVAVAIAQIRDGLAVGRPCGVALAHAGRLREIADLSILRRDGEELAACNEQRARAGWRHERIFDVAAHVLEIRQRSAKIADDADRDPLLFPAARVVAPEITAALVDDL